MHKNSPEKSEKPEKSNPLGRFDEFLTCVDCASSAHPYCLKYSSDLIDFIKTNRLKWQCYECKLCSVCLKTSENIVLCDKCDRGYHKECCQPALSKKPKGQFICHVCKQIYLKQIESNTEKQNLTSIKKFLNNFFKLLPIKNLQNNQIKSWSNRWKLFLSPLFLFNFNFFISVFGPNNSSNFLVTQERQEKNNDYLARISADFGGTVAQRPLFKFLDKSIF